MCERVFVLHEVLWGSCYYFLVWFQGNVGSVVGLISVQISVVLYYVKNLWCHFRNLDISLPIDKNVKENSELPYDIKEASI